MGAKLHLYALGLLSAGEEPLRTPILPKTGASPSFKFSLHAGFLAAVSLIRTILNLDPSVPEMGANEDITDHVIEFSSRRLLYHPKHYSRTMAFAAMFLIKFLAAEPEATESDKILARNHIRAVHRLFMQFPNSIEHLKGAQTIEIASRMMSTDGKQGNIRVKSRLGASIVHDVAMAIRAIIVDSPSPSTSGGTTQNSDETSQSYEGNAESIGIAVAQPSTSGITHHVPETLDSNWNIPWGMLDDSLFDTMEFPQGLEMDMGALLQ
ncbi:MAG: hypothetical protein M1827_007452 [Pycnora praestabilis]|nr:MAG: hypothetical protein M1827_007452 [Pycnora praestabilis]